MSEVGAGGAGFSPGAFMAGAIEEGLSARAALSAFREAGMSMGNQTFRAMYSEIREAVAARDVLAGLDYESVPADDVYTTWRAGAEGQYATFVQSFVRMPGERDIETRFYTHVTADPHTPQDAVDAAADYYTADDEGAGGTPRGSYQGSVVTSMTRTIGR